MNEYLDIHQFCCQFRDFLGIVQKQDIQKAARYLSHPEAAIQTGDDCAAIPDKEGYLLLAAEGMQPEFVIQEPWFAGWCGVMVNVSDIYAMGGYPIAVVDTLWSQPEVDLTALWEGLTAASRVYEVPLVGGHINARSPYNALSVAILGRARKLISGFAAQPGDVLLVASDRRGQPYHHYPFWNAATQAPPQRLREDLALLPQLAEMGLCDAGKDISMGGIIGTTLMLLETSGCGAILRGDRVTPPHDVSLFWWLTCFPSYGFLLSLRPENVTAVCQHFQQRDIHCEILGEVTQTPQVYWQWGDESALLWDFARNPLTGF